MRSFARPLRTIYGALHDRVERQRGHLFSWVPVCFGIGIGSYFSLTFEPGVGLYGVLLLSTVVAVAVFRLLREGPAVLLAALAIGLLGFCHMGLRTQFLAGPALEFRYYGVVEGRVIATDRSASDRMRITLDRVRLDGVRNMPARVRLSVDGEVPKVGAQIMTTAHLLPPQGPVEPGGFDFRRHMFFQEIGASGYTTMPVLERATASAPWLAALRARVSAHVRAALPERSAGVAAALIVGDRAHVDQEALQNLRDSNLAHLLAISGLHMGLFTGVVFSLLRLVLNLVPRWRLYLPVKKIAAVGALAAGFSYLLLSGASIATERAFVMVAVMLGAVLLDRQAISLRALALAALIVLLRRPESLLSPGFQMSFAATLALVVCFATLKNWRGYWQQPSWLRWGAGLVISSLVAGLATAPFGAAHFNTVSHYGLIANLLAVPVMAFVVAPAAVLTMCLEVVGLASVGYWVLDLGLAHILAVADWVSDWPGAKAVVVMPAIHVLVTLALGGLWLFLWQGRGRFAGVVPVVCALVWWSQTERPLALISQDAGLVGVLTEQGRALTRDKARGFVARSWLAHDGDSALQAEAAARWPTSEVLRIYTAQLQTEAGEVSIQHVIGKTGQAGLTSCAPESLLVFSTDVGDFGKTLRAKGCTVYDPKALRVLGSLSIDRTGAVTSVSQFTGDRLWTGAPPIDFGAWFTQEKRP